MRGRKLQTRKKNRFLEELRKDGHAIQSAGRVGVGVSTLYAHRAQDPEFAAAWEEAADEGEQAQAAALAAEADRRALHGVEEPVFHRGEVCGFVRKYSDNLLMFRLKALQPEKYRERHEVTGNLTLRQVMHGLRDSSGLPSERYPQEADD